MPLPVETVALNVVLLPSTVGPLLAVSLLVGPSLVGLSLVSVTDSQ